MKRASSAVLGTGESQHTKRKGNPMKRKASILGALAILAGLVLASTPASATTYTCDGGATPFTGNYSEGSPKSDTITITHSGSDCVVGGDAGLTGDIAVTGDITINVTGGKVTFKKNLISRDGKIKVTSSNSDVVAEKKVRAGGTIEILAGLTAAGSTGTIRIDENMTSDLLQTGTGQGHILLKAQGTVRTKSIFTTGEGQPSPRTVADGQSVKTGGIQIDANLYGSSSEFVIGTTGSGSYVDGEIDTRTTTGGGTSSFELKGGVRITNGTTSSTGDITLTAMNKIKVRATQSRSGFIILDAQDGKITLPAGTLDANGHLFDNNDAAQGYQAGGVGLFADTIEADDGTIISASQNKHSSTAVTQRQVAVVANTIKFKGSNGLEIHADGNASSFSTRGTAYALPQGLMVPESNDLVSNLRWTFSIPIYDNANSIVKFDGTGTGSDLAPLKITADGMANEVRIAGAPIEFHGGPVTIHSRGRAYFQGYYLNEVNLSSNPTGSGHSVKFAGKGAVAIDANGIDILDASTYGANAGFVNFSLGKALTVNSGGFTETSFTVTANGTTSQGAGGHVRIHAAALTIHSNSTTELDAKGTSETSGTGSGGSVTVESDGPVTVGGGNGKLNFSVAAAATGNGGKLNITGHPVNFVGNTGMLISANGGTTSGDGGEIHIFSHGGNITVNNSAANEVTLEAKAPTSGKGGVVQIANATTLSVNGARIIVDSKGSNGDGGSINLHEIGTLSFLGTGTTLKADGSGSGRGGSISLKSDNAITLGTGSGQVSVLARCDQNGGTGGGGSVSIESMSSSQALTIDTAHLDVATCAGGSAGGSILLKSGQDLTISGNLEANGIGYADGGYITVIATGNLTIAAGNPLVWTYFHAKSGDDGGYGGSIWVESANALNLYDAPVDLFLATGKDIGSGGTVSIKKVASRTGPNDVNNINKVIKVDGGPDADVYSPFGTISINDVRCQAWLTELDYPKTYWNCQDEDRATGMDRADAAHSLPSALRSQLGQTLSTTNPSVQIYAMNHISHYSRFFGDSSVFGAFGAGGISHLPTRVSASFSYFHIPGGGDSTVESISGSNTFRGAALVHELGHQLDYIWGMKSNLSVFQGYRTTDFAYMDGLTCTTVWPPGVCSIPGHGSNSAILLQNDSLIDPNVNTFNPHAELFARMFGHSMSTTNGLTIAPEVEAAYGFLTDSLNYVTNLINNPPTPVN